MYLHVFSAILLGCKSRRQIPQITLKQRACYLTCPPHNALFALAVDKNGEKSRKD